MPQPTTKPAAKPRKPRSQEAGVRLHGHPADRRPARRATARERRAHVRGRAADPRHRHAGAQAAAPGATWRSPDRTSAWPSRATGCCSCPRRASRWSSRARTCVLLRERDVQAVQTPPTAQPTARPASTSSIRRAHPGTNESRTVRASFSRFGSTSTTDCQVPSATRPPTTGTISDGDDERGQDVVAAVTDRSVPVRVAVVARAAAVRSPPRDRPRCRRPSRSARRRRWRAARRRAGGRRHPTSAANASHVRREVDDPTASGVDLEFAGPHGLGRGGPAPCVAARARGPTAAPGVGRRRGSGAAASGAAGASGAGGCRRRSAPRVDDTGQPQGAWTRSPLVAGAARRPRWRTSSREPRIAL